MMLSKFFLFTCALAPISYAAVAAIPSNALALLEQQKDLKIITSLIKRDPVLTKLYKEVKDVTITAAVDSSFPDFKDINTPPFNDLGLVRAIQQYIVLEGLYPTSSITTKAKYVSTKLTNSSYVNISRGKQVGKLVEENGKKTVTLGLDLTANIIQGVRQNSPAAEWMATERQFRTAVAAPLVVNYAISNLSSFGLLDQLDKTKDVTLFSISNPAWEKLINSKITLPSLKSLVEDLKYYVITPGVYYGDSFTGRSVQTLSGDSVTLAGYNNGQLTVNGVKVVQDDIITINGVIHILERYV
ncbi:MAG: hypothetical protein LQ342_006692 [Letrouitia transgressa]|nr:MAG: hypothetical protein LQ342_006692 [Letrouitia transgressa]